MTTGMEILDGELNCIQYQIDGDTFGRCMNRTIQPKNDSDMESILSMENQILLIILYSLTTIASFVGNVLVVIVFGRGRRCRTDLRPLLINLAVSDIVMATFCIPFTFTTAMRRTWVFSKPMCPIILFLQLSAVSASVYTNVAIGIDRYFAVTLPIRSRLSHRKAKYVAVFLIWIVSCSLSSIQLIVSRGVDYDFHGITLTKCSEYWPTHDIRQLYTLFIWLLTYALPLSTLFVTYTRVGFILWRRTSPGNADEIRDMQQLLSKQKVVKMLIIVVTMFGVCWLPLHVFILVIDFNPELLQYKSEEEEKFFIAVYYCVHWLAMSNSFANPIIYGFTNESFRADLAGLLYMWFPCCHCLRRRYSRQLTLTSYETVPIRKQSSYRKNHNSVMRMLPTENHNGTANTSLRTKVKTDSIDTDDELERFLDRNCNQSHV